jgi:hypothetical protein
VSSSSFRTGSGSRCCAHGLAVTGLHELYAPKDATPTRFDWVTPEWAHRWPVEEIWTAVEA